MTEASRKRLGDVLRGARGEAHMSQEALAEAVGVSLSTMKRWEAGAEIGVSQLALAASAVGLTTEELLKRAGLIPR